MSNIFQGGQNFFQGLGEVVLLFPIETYVICYFSPGGGGGGGSYPNPPSGSVHGHDAAFHQALQCL